LTPLFRADDEERELALEVKVIKWHSIVCFNRLKVLGSRGEAEKAREIEAAAEKERLKAAAAAKAGTILLDAFIFATVN
jgi:hypothetical protein